MNYTQLESICKCIFGRSWKSQFADYLAVDRRRVHDWEKVSNPPAFVERELLTLIERRKIEFSAINALLKDDFYHEKAMIDGKIHYLDENILYTEHEINFFINSQKWRVTEDVKKLRKTDATLEDAIEYIETDFLSENDIASFIENNNIESEVDIDDIKEKRAEACLDVKQFAEALFN